MVKLYRSAQSSFASSHRFQQARAAVVPSPQAFNLHGCTGVVMVEATIVLPVFLLLVFGIIFFARYAMQKASLDLAVLDAGRFGATLEGDCLTPAKGRFFDKVAGTGFEHGIVFRGDVIRLNSGAQALQITATGVKDNWAFFGAVVRSFGLFPVEVPGGCSGLQSITASSPN